MTKNPMDFVSTVLSASTLFFFMGTTTTQVMAATDAIQTQALRPIPSWHPPHNPINDSCSYYSDETGWIPVECTPDSVARSLPHLTEGSSFGVSGVQPTTSPTHAETLLSFTTYSGESDDTWGSGSYSIQANSNVFTGSNGDTDWVQFTEQNLNGGTNQVCIWQIDISTQDYSHVNCRATSAYTLSSTFQAYVDGDVVNSNQLQATFCEAVSHNCWATLPQSDLWGFTNGKWTTTSGTILGAGGGSQANFVSPTLVQTLVYNSPASSASYMSDTTTAETNNLNLTSHTTNCGSPGGTCITSFTASN